MLRFIRVAKKRPLISAGATVVLALVVWRLFSGSSSETVQTTYFDVKKGDFLISIIAGGSIEAVNEISIRNEVEGSARIIYIVPEGTYVKKGAMIVELDSAMALDQVNQQQISFEKAQFSMIQANETLEIQKSLTDSDVRASELKLEFAKIDLDKYLKGDSFQTLREAQIAAEKLRENLAIAREKLYWSQELFKKDFENKTVVDNDRLSVTNLQLSLEVATNKIWVIQTYEHPKMLRKVQSDLEEAKNDLERVKHQVEAKLAQYRADVETQKNTLALQQRKLDRDKKNLAATKILAPADGLAVFPVSNNRFSSESLIEEGATVRNRQEMLKLPDVSKMKLTVKVHESQVSKVKPGLAAYVVLDPMPEKRFKGFVSKVGLLPDTSSRFGNPDLKVYITEILISDEIVDIKPGVSAHAEVIITNLVNVITVPIQSVTTLKGKPVVYTSASASRAVPVEVGLFNTKFIQIVSGLKEGDRVMLSPPLDSKPADMDGSIMEEGEKPPTNDVSMVPPPPNPAGSRKPGASLSPNQKTGPSENRGNSERDDSGRGAPQQEGAKRSGAGGGFNRDEMMKQMKLYDKNGDGKLDEEERAAMRAAMPSGGGGTGRQGEKPQQKPVE